MPIFSPRSASTENLLVIAGLIGSVMFTKSTTVREQGRVVAVLDGQRQHVTDDLHAAGMAVVRKADAVLEPEPGGDAITRVRRRRVESGALGLTVAAEPFAVAIARFHSDHQEAAVAGLAGRIVAERIVRTRDLRRVATASDDQVRVPSGPSMRASPW